MESDRPIRITGLLIERHRGKSISGSLSTNLIAIKIEPIVSSLVFASVRKSLM